MKGVKNECEFDFSYLHENNYRGTRLSKVIDFCFFMQLFLRKEIKSFSLVVNKENFAKDFRRKFASWKKNSSV
jgi:hypothetical protein